MLQYNLTYEPALLQTFLGLYLYFQGTLFYISAESSMLSPASTVSTVSQTYTWIKVAGISGATCECWFFFSSPQYTLQDSDVASYQRRKRNGGGFVIKWSILVEM
jgi:hypothetical protein